MHGSELDRALMACTLASIALMAGCETRTADGAQAAAPTAATIEEPRSRLVNAGQEIFRFDTFGDEQFWTDTLRMHEVVESAVDPMTALKVGLKVDAEALPPGCSRRWTSPVRPRRSPS
jgi:hypothetical protein